MVKSTLSQLSTTQVRPIRSRTMSYFPELRCLRRALRGRAGPGRLDDAGGRSGDAGLGHAEARRGRGERVPSGFGRRRRGARALFDHRHEAGPDLALHRRQGIAQPPGPGRCGGVRRGKRPAARLAPQGAGGIPDRPAGRLSADGRRHGRLFRLRHGAPDGAPAEPQARAHRRYPRRAAGPTDHHGDLRHGEGRDPGGDARAPRSRRSAPRSPIPAPASACPT